MGWAAAAPYYQPSPFEESFSLHFHLLDGGCGAMTGKELRQKLKVASANVRTGIFDMLSLTASILQDDEYVAKHGGQDALLDNLEATEFAHFGGSPSLRGMLRAYQVFPTRRAWSKQRYNVRAMVLKSGYKTSTESKKRINWKALAQERLETIENLKKTVMSLRSELETERTHRNELSSQLAVSERKVATLEGALSQVGKMTV